MAMLKIGLTGGIGSGKTTVAQIFKVLGVPVFDADSAAKKIMQEDESLKAALVATFGPETYINGILNRKHLSSLVFTDPYQLELLNALVHPASIAAGLQWATQQDAPYIIKEAALMFEAGSGYNLDFIIGVYAPQTLRIHRAMKRDNLTRQEVLNRISRQVNDTIKMKLCDFVIVNDDQQLLIPQVLKLHEHFMQLARQQNPKP